MLTPEFSTPSPDLDDDARTSAPHGPLVFADSRGTRAQFSKSRITVGTAEGNDFVIPSRSASRLHALIVRDGSRVIVQDLDSTNGTYVNGIRATRLYLPRRARVRFGDFEVEIAAASDLEADESVEEFAGMVSRSFAMRCLFDQIRRVSCLDHTVLITGESGVGKDLVARAIHDLSDRQSGPMVVVDCGSLNHNLVESELFGHERGAFTGAVDARDGAFQRADGGTLFLDEIGELSLDLQPRLLRFLEQGTVCRVGGREYRHVNVRVVAATHRDLGEMVRRGEFREDLYYRLEVLRLNVPSLRERPEDIDVLARHFAQGLTQRQPELRDRVDRIVLSVAERQWTGNVRELKNYVERTMILDDFELAEGTKTSATPLELQTWIHFDKPYAELREELLDAFEREYVSKATDQFGDSPSKIARECRMNRPNLLRLLKKHNLR